MLKSLYIKNYAIISELNIDFDDRFNVFTGETGAGKSIIVGALSFLIKGKADPGVIRNGQDKAIIEGVFTVNDYMKEQLDEAGIEYDDEIIIRRIISRDNHNSIRLNQCSVTLSFLENLFNEHIDIHSQKDSQYLLNRRNHLTLLDKYAGNFDLLETYESRYEDYLTEKKEYEHLSGSTYNEADLEYVRYDLKELDDAKISAEEEEELNGKEKIYKSLERYLSSLSGAIGIYEDEQGIDEKLSLLIKSLNIDDEKISSIKENIENISFSLSDEMDKLKDIFNSINEEDLDIEKIEERLYLYSRLKRKHNTDVTGLLKKKEELEERIRFFEDKDLVLNEKKKKMDEAYAKAAEIARQLHEKRVEAGRSLVSKVVAETEDLMLNNVEFEVRIEETELSRKGIDDLEFYISLNRGEELKPLRNVASGGEISRLMLALKTVFTSLSDNSLVIFDEIDSGVSGKTGLAMGIKMAQIARNTQVLAITHLAPVAACADRHFYIYKEDDDGSSNTLVRELNEDEIINELAFISSADNSESSVNAARQLYETAQESVKR